MHTARQRSFRAWGFLSLLTLAIAAPVSCFGFSAADQVLPDVPPDLAPDAVIVSTHHEQLPAPTGFTDCVREGGGLSICALKVEMERQAVRERCLDRSSTEPKRIIVRACTYSIRNDLLEGRAQAYLFVNRADAYFSLGYGKYALADYDRAIELWPHLAPLYFNRGVFYATIGDFARAHADFESALQFEPRLLAARRMEAMLVARGHSALSSPMR